MANWSIGAYTFERNPIEADKPDSEKTVAEVKTYSGSALFQWSPTIEGQSVKLTWKIMSATMYAQLRTLYLSTSEVTFSCWDDYTYQVVVTNLKCDLFLFRNADLQFLKNVEMTLNIRSAAAV